MDQDVGTLGISAVQKNAHSKVDLIQEILIPSNHQSGAIKIMVDKNISESLTKKGEFTPQSPVPKRVSPAMIDTVIKPLKPIIKSKWDSALKHDGFSPTGSRADLIDNQLLK